MSSPASAASAASIGSPRAQHLPALDGVRGIAIVMVMICHFIAYATPKPVTHFWTAISSVGGTGVDLFFVLSGFLITRILLASRDSPQFLRNFYMRRALRIVPMYYGFLAVLYIGLPLLRIAQPVPLKLQLWTWTYLQNIKMTFAPQASVSLAEWTPHFWSLAVEEHFYLVWPFVIKTCKRRNLPIVLLATLPISILCRCVLMRMGYGAGYFTLCRLDALGLGSLLAVLDLTPGRMAELGRFTKRWLFAFAIPVALGYYWMSGKQLWIAEALKSSGWAMIYFVVLVAALNAPPFTLCRIVQPPAQADR